MKHHILIALILFSICISGCVLKSNNPEQLSDEIVTLENSTLLSYTCVYMLEPQGERIRPLEENMFFSTVDQKGKTLPGFNAVPYDSAQSKNVLVSMISSCRANQTIGIVDVNYSFRKDYQIKLIKNIWVCMDKNSIPKGDMATVFGNLEITTDSCKGEWLEGMCCKKWFMPD